MTTIDTARIIGLLAEAVEEEGPDTTRECYYRFGSVAKRRQDADNGLGTGPHCIAGVVVYKVGGQEALDRLSENSVIMSSDWTDMDTGADRNEKVLDELGFTPEAKQVLNAAQNAQDVGYTWGKALDDAQELAAKKSVGDAD